jgi:hypothetical protein
LIEKFNPQFVEEDPKAPALEYPARRAVFDEIWNTEELLKLYRQA